MTLFGKKVFAVVVKGLEMRSSLIIWGDLKSSDQCPYKSEAERDLTAWGGGTRPRRQRVESRKLKEAEDWFSPEPSDGVLL